MKTSLQFPALLLLLTTVLFAFGCKPKQPAARKAAPNWVRLGERLVDFKADKDVIAVTGERGKFTALKLKVNRAPIFLNAVTITFGNGETHRWPINRRIAAGEMTRPVDLPGGARVIRKVAFTYKTGPRSDAKAAIVLWGRR